MKSAGAALNTHIQGEATTLAQFWKVKRTDGTIFTFTSHDADLSVDLSDGDGTAIYEAETSFKRTAISNNDELAVDNLDVEGLLKSDKIDETELRRGLFDFAEVWVFIANYESLGDGFIRMRRGWFGEVTITPNGVFKTELRGMTQVLARIRSDVYEAECPYDLGSVQCGVPIFPSEVANNTAYAVGDYVRASNDKFIPLTITNPGAESGTTGWTNEIGTLDATDVQVTARTGSAYFAGGNAQLETKAYQDITVPVAQEAEIDAGNRSIRFLGYQQSVNEATDDTAQLTIRFYDGSMVQLGSEIAGTLAANVGSWAQVFASGSVPANTRTIRLAMRMVGNTGPDTDAFFDDLSADLIKTNPLSEDFHDRIFQCTTAGTTGAIQPSFDTTLTNTTTYGSAVFTAEEAWSRAIEVTAVGSDARRTFTVTELTPNSGGSTVGRDHFPDDALNGGVVVWESGNNAGRGMEVKDFTADDGVTIEQVLTLFLQMPYDIAIGDKARVYRGCDKSRATCRDIFANARRFGGYPDVPGQQVFNYPDAKS